MGNFAQAQQEAPVVQVRRAPAAGREDEKLRQVGDGFEAMMLDMLYRQMQQSNEMMEAGGDNPFAPSGAEKIYRAMRDEAVVRQLAGSRPLGFGDMALRQLKGESGVPRGALVKAKKRPPSVTEGDKAPGG